MYNQTKPRWLRKFAHAAIVLAAGLYSPAWATHYTIEYFPVPSGATSAAVNAINSSGQMAGASHHRTVLSEITATIWAADGTVTELPATRVYNYAKDINDAGQVAVSAAPEVGQSGDGYVLFNGVKTIIPPLPGGDPNGVSVGGINRLGHVAGTSGTASGAQHAYLYADGTSIDLGTLPGYTQSFAYAVNDAGQVVGVSANNGTDIGGYKPNRAFLWSNGTLTDLGSIKGYDGFIATDINNNGQVLGYAYRSSDGAEIPFLWSNGVMQALPGAGNNFHANDINDLGQIVGTLTLASGENRAALWQNGVMEYLGSHFDRPLSSAGAINNLGQIAGTVSTFNSDPLIFRLTPVLTPPLAKDVSASGPSAQVITWQPDVVSVNPSVCRIVTGPANGTATVAADCTTGTYQSNLGFIGIDSFTYLANDGTADSNPATVTVTVTEPSPSSSCLAQYPVSQFSHTGKDGTITISFTGNIVSYTNKVVKVCPGTALKYQTSSTKGPVVCRVKNNITRGSGDLRINDHLKCTDKPAGKDKIQFKVKSGVK